MSTTKVIIVGCGIAGPVLATFLKLKGYNPVIYERTERGSSEGISLGLQINGYRVLSLIPGLAEKLPGQNIDRNAMYSTVPGDERLLFESDSPKTYVRDKFGFGVRGLHRPTFHKLLIQTALDHGVEIHWNYKVVGIEQTEDQVIVSFESGGSDTASIVIGCDGIHSNSRICLFGREEATYTGLTQIGGFSPTPVAFSESPTMYNFFGHAVHIITYPVSDTHNAWAIARKEPETKESWRAVNDHVLEQYRNDPTSEWGFGVSDLIKGATTITKFGLYDRPELPTWHQGRVALLGDAAHPTTPHLGQGANQAFEDIYHLVKALLKNHSDPNSPLTTKILSKIFSEYEAVRLVRTSEMVKAARGRGDQRVIEDLEECKKRDAEIAAMSEHLDEKAIVAQYENLVNYPYVGESAFQL